MIPKINLVKLLESPVILENLAKLYGHDDLILKQQAQRYLKLARPHKKFFSAEPVAFFSSPGRTEIGGNHTDHNHGKVLAASVNLDTIAAVNLSNDNKITIFSEGYSAPFVVDIRHTRAKTEERGTTTALIRGIVARFKEFSFNTGGFNATLTSNVLVGSGLSSSASVEVLVGTILNHLFNDARIKPEEIAKIGQYAENNYFGKPCGLMDQMAIAVGGIIAIDFKDPLNPVIRKVKSDFSQLDYSLLVVDTGGSHVNLTADYAAIPHEMQAVAKSLGGQTCRDITYKKLVRNIASLRQKVGDRPILRAMHFLAENERVEKMVLALEGGMFDVFLNLVNESGASSARWLQNNFSTKNPNEQGVGLALALTEIFIKNSGK
ncbi:MAG: galactokinase family protein, partial [Candidatus Neomarinimicrobiota bacterium]